jgi:hypothetical protein
VLRSPQITIWPRSTPTLIFMDGDRIVGQDIHPLMPLSAVTAVMQSHGSSSLVAKG